MIALKFLRRPPPLGFGSLELGFLVLAGMIWSFGPGFVLAGDAVALRVFYVDATRGSDQANGRSPETAWRTLAKVNQSPLEPGDRVLFKRGEAWRGQLVPQSGRENAPITYGAYGVGEKPILLGSVSRSRPEDWQPGGSRIWVTGGIPADKLVPVAEFAKGTWAMHTEGAAKARSQWLKPSRPGEPATLRIDGIQAGASANQIQLYRGGLPLVENELYYFKFQARGSKPFEVSGVRLMKQSPPYAGYSSSHSPVLRIATNWAEQVVRFKSRVTASDGRITLFLGGALPADSQFEFQPVALLRAPGGDQPELSVDVGNIIFDHGKAVGVKKWQASDLKQPGDYWYDGASWQVRMFADQNPATLHQSIELALRQHIIDEGNKSHLVFENLALRYGAAHGIGGASTHHVVVCDCDISWIGGGHQHTRPDGKPVRFGNGIEFWSNAHDNLVESCRIWEIYDAALTNQGDNRNAQYNITYRHNVIWNSEYSFEFWNGKDSAKTGMQQSSTRNIRFERNTCYNAGFGWGHAQRPDRNGRHLMFFNNPAATEQVRVLSNIFCNATESGLRMYNDWTAALEMDHNCWFQVKGPLIYFLKTNWLPEQFAEYQKTTRLDTHSVVADPKFREAARQDFRSDAAVGPVGSSKRLTD